LCLINGIVHIQIMSFVNIFSVGKSVADAIMTVITTTDIIILPHFSKAYGQFVGDWLENGLEYEILPSATNLTVKI
ncbi:hypothetical protein T4E_9521, partial [Trichinella pseudospiralis]